MIGAGGVFASTHRLGTNASLAPIVFCGTITGLKSVKKTKMKNPQRLLRAFSRLSLAIGLVFSAANAVAEEHVKPAASEPIPWAELGARAQAGYSGDGLDVRETHSGALLRAAFQKLEGDATSEGLWIRSTAEGETGRFRVRASALGRAGGEQVGLHGKGTVTFSEGNPVKFLRPRLVEEYSTSMDGLRQDFVVQSRPEGEGDLRVEISVDGARVEQAEYGARLVLESGRNIAYNRLKVLDADNREFSARISVISESSFAITVEESDATYPVRIDPTFCDENWISTGGRAGADNAILAMAIDGAGNVYIGGTFTAVGSLAVGYVAKWDGSAWSTMGSGVNQFVTALLYSGTDLYVGGGFTQAGGVAANRVAKWDGNSWAPLGAGVNNSVTALATDGAQIYAGGNFTTAGGAAASRVARWNGSSWSALGLGVNNSVNAMASVNGMLYVGGAFSNAGGAPASRIAQWNGVSWAPLAQGVNGAVNAIAPIGGEIIVGGAFTSAGGAGASRIARWNGTGWFPLGGGASSPVTALTIRGSEIYAGGTGIQMWNGAVWATIAPDGDGVRALAFSGSVLFAGGAFRTVGGVPADYVAKMNGGVWSRLGNSGFNGSVAAMLVSGSDLFVAGEFTLTPGGPANRIARWNGTTWTALGLGLNQRVNVLAGTGTALYAGGLFTSAGGIAANGIARWNGSAWSALGSGVQGSVIALAVSGATVYAGGAFGVAGAVAANNIARWNGSSWSAMGPGFDGSVYALALSGSTLYAGGTFWASGGTTLGRLAKWNGSSWSEVGGGVGDHVYALATSGTDLFIGGSVAISTPTGTAYNIAKWNGTVFSPLGAGTDGSVWKILVAGGTLYVAGTFSAVGETIPNWNVAAQGIAIWNGSMWSAMGSGVPFGTGVGAMAMTASGLYVGGTFQTIGGKISPNLIRAVFPANAAPTAISLSGAMPPENTLLVGTLLTTDANSCDMHTYALVSGAGSADNAAFAISGNVLSALTPFDFEARNSYSIRLRSTDLDGAFTERAFSITVGDENETPSNVLLSNDTLTENLPAGTVIGSFAVLDQDATDTHTFSLVDGTGDSGNEAVAIDGSTLRAARPYDYELGNIIEIRVRATDSGGLFTERQFFIRILDGNDAPSDLQLSNAAISENVPTGTVVGAFATEDPDGFGIHTYSLVGGSGADNNNRFLITGDTLVTAGAVDFEAMQSLNVRVRATDTDGLHIEKAFVISIADVDEPPVVGADSVNRGTNTRVARVLANSLLANDSDPEGQAVAITAVGSAAPEGATVAMLGNFVVYTAPANTSGHGSFNYTISAGAQTTTGTVAIVEVDPATGEASAAAASISHDATGYVLRFIGVPGRSYTVQYTSDAGPIYTWNDFDPVAAYIAANNGVFTYTDANPPGPMRLYRAISSPSNNN